MWARQADEQSMWHKTTGEDFILGKKFLIWKCDEKHLETIILYLRKKFLSRKLDRKHFSSSLIAHFCALWPNLVYFFCFICQWLIYFSSSSSSVQISTKIIEFDFIRIYLCNILPQFRLLIFVIYDQIGCIFSDISERNNDYSDTLDFRRGWVGVVTFFVLEVPDYASAMLIYFYIYKKIGYRSQLWSNFHEIHMVGAGSLMGEPYCFWKQSAQ